MKTMRKALALITLVAMMLTMAVGCGGTSSSTSTAQGDDSATGTAAGELVIPEEPVEVWWLDRSDIDSKDPVVEAKDNKLAEMVKEKFNVILKRERVSQTTYNERLNVLFASGEYPDIVSDAVFNNDMSEAIDAGLLLPLDSILETDENWKSVDKSMMQDDIYDGSLYALHNLTNMSDGLFYRVDWMQNLNLSMPTNPDEMYELLRAFTYDDPDQNGKDDTFGLSISSTFDQTAPIFLPTRQTSHRAASTTTRRAKPFAMFTTM